MTQALLNQILTQLQSLEPSELQHLSQVIQSYLEQQDVSVKQASFHQALLEAGLVRQIKHPNFDERAQTRLIQVQGEPLSQTIIGERR